MIAIFIFLYSLLLFFSLFYKAKRGEKVASSLLLLVGILSILSVVFFFLSLIWIKVCLAMALLVLSRDLFLDRKKSGQEVNLSHHLIRLAIHLLFIYFIF